MAADPNTRVLSDPRSIRALAHPARMAIIDALALGDELTATECAEVTGLSPSATAYHLKLLERYGLVEPAAARQDGRERPWRAPTRRTQVEIDTSTPAGASAAAALGLALLDSSRAVAEDFVAAGSQEPKEWRDVASLNNANLWLTIEETEELTAAFTAALEPYRGRAKSDRPEGSRRVRVTFLATPFRRRR